VRPAGANVSNRIGLDTCVLTSASHSSMTKSGLVHQLVGEQPMAQIAAGAPAL
jgi:hypothetical protein